MAKMLNRQNCSSCHDILEMNMNALPVMNRGVVVIELLRLDVMLLWLS